MEYLLVSLATAHGPNSARKSNSQAEMGQGSDIPLVDCGAVPAAAEVPVACAATPPPLSLEDGVKRIALISFSYSLLNCCTLTSPYDVGTCLACVFGGRTMNSVSGAAVSF